MKNYELRSVQISKLSNRIRQVFVISGRPSLSAKQVGKSLGWYIDGSWIGDSRRMVETAFLKAGAITDHRGRWRLHNV